MNRLKLFFAALLTVCVSATIAEVDLKDVRIAVIWNPNTDNENTPYGWNVGGNAKVVPLHEDEESDPAPEIGLAQLKFVLSAIYPDEIKTGGSLDIDGFDFNFEHRGGDLWGIDGLLKNVRVYNMNSNVSYKDIVGDFGGDKPQVICYVGAGAGVDGTEKDYMFKLFTEASNNNVGTMLIGSKSATDAREIDKSKKVFPVMGVQKSFRFQLFDGDTIKAFQFFTDNDEKVDPKWKIADTIVLSGDGVDKGIMHLIQGGRRTKVYEGSNDNGWINNSGYTRATGADAPKVMYKYGEWSIYAKAVDIIDVDYYPAEMNYGLHSEYNFYAGYIGNDVYMLKEESMPPSLIINGIETNIKAGNNLTGYNANPLIIDQNEIKIYNDDREKDEYFKKVKEDWIFELENPENESKKDKIVVLRKGTLIPKADYGMITGNWTNQNYDDWPSAMPTFYAGGLRELRIELLPNSDIYKDIFVSEKLKGVTTLEFRPWSVEGRISADADLWEFNDQLDTASFNQLISGGRFNPDTYYRDYLASQNAGSVKGKYQQFLIPPSKSADFGDFKRADELPATSSSPSGYYNDFKDKKFHALSVVQKNKQRLAMVGYQPTFLKDPEKSRAIIHDLLLWIGFDHWTLPDPIITVDNEPITKDDEYKKIDKPIKNVEINIKVDTKDMPEKMKECDPKLRFEIFYNGKRIYDNEIPLSEIPLTGDTRVLDITEYYRSRLPDNASVELLEVKTLMIPNEVGSCAIYSKSDETDVIIERNRQQKPLVAELWDTTADGKPDLIKAPFDVVYLNKDKVDGLTKVVVTIPWGNGKTIEISINPDDGDRIDTKHGDTIYIYLTDDEVEKFGLHAKFEKKDWLEWFGATVKDGKEKGDMIDKIAPVIEKAVLKPAKDNSYPGKLEITFTKDLNTPGNGEVFYIYDDKGNPHKVTVKDGKSLGGNKYEYVIVSIEGGYIPSDKDPINVNIDAKLKDANGGNVIDNPNNRKVPLTVEAKPIEWGVTVITKDLWNDKGGKLDEIIKDEKGGKIIDDKTVVVVILDPGKITPKIAKEAEVKSAVILDAVGNKVIETSKDMTNTNNHFNAYRILLNGEPKFGVVWDGKNNNGRDVGAAIYMSKTVVTWPGKEMELFKPFAVPAKK